MNEEIIKIIKIIKKWLQMGHSFEVQRISELSYTVKFQDKNFKPLIINILEGNHHSKIDQNHEFFFNLVNEFASSIVKSVHENQKFESSIKIGDRCWVIKAYKKNSPLLSHILPLLHKQGNDGIIRLEIERKDSFNPLSLAFPGLNTVSFKNAAHDEDVYNETTLNKFNLKTALRQQKKDCQIYSGLLPCNKDQLKSGIRGIFDIKEQPLKERLSRSVFDDGYTILSTIAFQRYEREFSGHDQFRPEDCRYCLVIENDQLQLTQISSELRQKKPVHQKTIEHYRALLISEYGAERTSYACGLCQIDFDQMLKTCTPLTPEHVYRMNVTLGNVETADLNSFLHRLTTFRNAFTDSYKRAGKASDVWQVIEGIKAPSLTLNEIRGIIRVLHQNFGEVPPSSLLSWMDHLQRKKKLELMPPDLFDELTQVFFPNTQDFSKIFTGRDIYFPIYSSYTTAGKQDFKPWIDEQELLHIFPVIQNTKDWDMYNEKLAHVVCKKHLFRKHPTKGYTTGALIPAPLDEQGHKRWYKVSQAVHNGYGMVCYTLESACNDPSLPLIKLYRSTSSDPYAIFGGKSVRSDVNPLGAPGYEGKGRTDCYEESKIISHTIPVWTGYMLAAKAQLQEKSVQDEQKLKGVFHTLLTSNQELHEFEAAKLTPLSFKSILHKHTPIINTLYIKGGLGHSFYSQLRDEYFWSSPAKKNEKIGVEETQKNAQLLIEKTISFQSNLQSFDPAFQIQLKTEIDHFINDLNDYLLIYPTEIEKQNHLSKLHEIIFQKLDAFETACMECIKKREFVKAVQLMKMWATTLEGYAKSSNENLSSKEKKDLLFVGHSLGGALAQLHTVHFLVEKRRMPCPDKQVFMAAFDAPGIMEEDNEKYKQYLYKHAEMFKATKAEFKIYHQHEASDPLATLGTHLGSANDLSDASNILLTMCFKAVVLKRNPNAKQHTLAFTSKVHATQFLEGKVGVDYNFTDVDPYTLKLMESHELINDLPKEIIAEKGKKIRAGLWKFALPISPLTMDKVRSHPITFSLAKGLFSNWIEQDPQMQSSLDPYGNFAVDENGLPYQQMMFFPSTVLPTPQGGMLQTFGENKLRSYLYPASDTKMLVQALFNPPKDELLAEVAEFEKHLEIKSKIMEAIGGKRLSIAISTGRIEAMLLTPENFIGWFAYHGVKQLTVRIKDQISTVYAFDAENHKDLLLILKVMKFEEIGWEILDFSTQTLLGEQKFLNAVTKESDLQLVETKIPTLESSNRGVLICGGSASRYQMHLTEAASFLLRGMKVMLFNPPGHGDHSEGDPNQNTMLEATAAVYDKFVKLCEFKEEHVLIKSLCMSGGCAAELASLHPYTALWLDQSYSSFPELVDQRISSALQQKFSEKTAKTITSLIPKAFFPSFDVASCLTHHKGWKCLTYAGQDEIISFSHTERNLKSVESNALLRVVELPGKHAQTWYRLKDTEDAVQQTGLVQEQIDDFLERADLLHPLIVTKEEPLPAWTKYLKVWKQEWGSL